MNRTLVASLALAAVTSGCHMRSNRDGGTMSANGNTPNGGGMMPSGAAMPAMGANPGSIQPGGQVAGSLAQGDFPLQDGSVADNYNIMLTMGQPVTIVTCGGPSMTTPGSNLDVYTLLMQNNAEVTHDDDSAGNLNSRIVWTPLTTGMYQIRVSTFSSGLKQGMYTLRVMAGMNPTATCP